MSKILIASTVYHISTSNTTSFLLAHINILPRYSCYGTRAIEASNLIKAIGSNFEDKGDYYSITGYMWLDGSIFSTGNMDVPVRARMEVRYYGPTGYTLVAITSFSVG